MMFFSLFLISAYFSQCFASEAVEIFANGIVKYSGNIYKELVIDNNTKGKNFITSPLGVQVILALVGEGCKGVTAQQLITGLQLPNTNVRREVINHYRTLNPFIKGTFELNLAIKLYISRYFKVLPSFLDLARNIYKSDIENIDFSNHVLAANNINKWVALETNNTIQGLVDANELSALTKFVTVSALYFRGDWTRSFSPQRTDNQNFFPRYCNNNKIAKIVKTMNAINTYLFLDSSALEAKFLEIPYKNSNCSMTFILPHEQDGLCSIEKDIQKYLQKQKLTTELVDVSIPKFNITSSINYIPLLRKLGITQVFEETADMTGISTQRDLFIQFVTQKAFIGVNEQGTLATAASAAVGVIRSLPLPPPDTDLTFKADHPFFYYIRDNESGVILFIGRYVQ
uniref:Antichymotrypsin-2-like n=1 Tax=Diabrotica virgifera virgifera TaxID=50390 RepID=A0A6P7FLZ1_DIAVI